MTFDKLESIYIERKKMKKEQRTKEDELAERIVKDFFRLIGKEKKFSKFLAFRKNQSIYKK